MSKFIITIPADREHLADIESLTAMLGTFNPKVEPLVYDDDDIAILNATIETQKRTIGELTQRLDFTTQERDGCKAEREAVIELANGRNARITELERDVESLDTDLNERNERIATMSAQYDKLLATIRGFIGDHVRNGDLDEDALIVKSLLSFGMDPFTRDVTAIIDYGAIEVRYDIEGVPDGVADEDIEEALMTEAVNKWERIVRGESLSFKINDEEYEALCRDVDMNRRAVRVTTE